MVQVTLPEASPQAFRAVRDFQPVVAMLLQLLTSSPSSSSSSSQTHTQPSNQNAGGTKQYKNNNRNAPEEQHQQETGVDMDLAAAWVTLGYRCSASFRVTDYRGGCNGAFIRFPPEITWPMNRGLDVVLAGT